MTDGSMWGKHTAPVGWKPAAEHGGGGGGGGGGNSVCVCAGRTEAENRGEAEDFATAIRGALPRQRSLLPVLCRLIQKVVLLFNYLLEAFFGSNA